ncbi:glycosyltransferase family 4 protein [Hymenobacter profundi]|uniref:Glycosyltransferase family 4 protein n=1 Tax=Hymenobacter profundi TaxID=1982110 RepID=A0ABS6X262_9BACT|nr:glycosyltransferase family 4 protein [Hymenobacter profundi]MBW3129572.1 glycosyltransferase family 4 protein [Hymenobacter profundi]
MNVLLSAYACNPTKGGENGIGYHWTQEWLRHGHEVWCFTRPDERADIEAYLAKHSTPENRDRLHFVYVAVPSWVDYLYRWQFGVYLHYMVWQYQAWRAARKLEATVGFDLIHHATYGSLQMASWLWRVGKPLVIGPLGGGQQTPRSFQSYIPDWFKSETMRNTISRVLMASDRNVRQSIRHAALVLTTNNETAEKVRALGARRVELFLDSGLPESFLPAQFPVREPAAQLRLLWLGRLIHRKALPLVLDALAKVAARVPYHLTIVGDGPVGAELPEMLRQRGLTERVTWRGSLPWAEVREVFLTHDVFMFASLRDSFASQFLEAMGAGLPIITLNHQGARDFIPTDAAIKVSVTTPDETVTALARAVEYCYDHPERRVAMGQAGYAFARTQIWPARSQRIMQLIEEAVPQLAVLKNT